MKQDYQRVIDDCSNELTNIKTWIDRNPTDSNVRYLISYSVVKSSGTIELVFKQMVFDFLADHSKIEAQKYLSTMIIDSSCNPSTGNMSRILSQFDGVLANRFDSNVKNTQAKTDLNSLVSLRNDLAHGRTNNPSINTVIDYYNSGITILGLVDRELTPQTQ